MQQQEVCSRRLALELFLVSAVSLYLELLIIRWFSGEIRFFTVFRTFPLIVCFVGLGFGCLMSNPRIFRWAPLALLYLVSLVQAAALSGCRTWMFPSASIYFWQDLSLAQTSYVFLCIPIVIGLLSGPFAVMTCIGARIGDLFNRFSPLAAYSINVGGAIAGSIVFACLSYAGLHPSPLLAPAALLLAALGSRRRTSMVANVLFVTTAIVLSSFTFEPKTTTVYWSPYQRLSVMPLNAFRQDPLVDARSGAAGASSEIDYVARASLQDVLSKCFVILSNHSIYQEGVDLRPASVELSRLYQPWAGIFAQDVRHYSMPYRLAHPENLLIVGAGCGNDVASALRHNVTHIDAVELDPLILAIGSKFHPEKPFASKRVAVICNDARNFFARARTRYDMIIIAGVDSHTVTGPGSSVRVDCYIHTKESIQQAYRLLRNDGLLLLTFWTTQDWLRDRLFATVRSAVGYDPVVLRDQTPGYNYWTTFLVGPPIADGSLKLDWPALQPFARISPATSPDMRIVSDDWPYLYVRPLSFDSAYWLMMLIIGAICFAAVRPTVVSHVKASNVEMFFLGAAFLLLELKSVAQLSLLYGSTWLTSAVVIVVILSMALLANLTASKCNAFLASKTSHLYGLLWLLLALSYCAPNQELLQKLTPEAAYVCVTMMSLLPLFAASLIFSLAFARAGEPGRALAFNLLGAVIGGLLEYAAIYTGINSLVVLAGCLYLFSFLAARRATRPVIVPATRKVNGMGHEVGNHRTYSR
ncbi:MAG TPA: hypothetical protein V6D17_01665 [Candidatus Obscuribacterales bacterium]